MRLPETGNDHDDSFSALFERHRRELHIHCYRMVGSFEDAEDLVQETLLRAWRGRSGFTFQDSAASRSWLYRIATNVCLDFLAAHARRVPAVRRGAGGADVAWLQPYPDRLLDGIAPTDAEPDSAVVTKETIELVFLVAIQHLSPRQRAVLILRDVLGWSAKDTASTLDWRGRAGAARRWRRRWSSSCPGSGTSGMACRAATPARGSLPRSAGRTRTM